MKIIILITALCIAITRPRLSTASRRAGRGVQRFGEHVHGDDDGVVERVGDVQSERLRRLRGGGEPRAVRPGGVARAHAVP